MYVCDIFLIYSLDYLLFEMISAFSVNIGTFFCQVSVDLVRESFLLSFFPVVLQWLWIVKIEVWRTKSYFGVLAAWFMLSSFGSGVQGLQNDVPNRGLL